MFEVWTFKGKFCLNLFEHEANLRTSTVFDVFFRNMFQIQVFILKASDYGSGFISYDLCCRKIRIDFSEEISFMILRCDHPSCCLLVQK